MGFIFPLIINIWVVSRCVRSAVGIFPTCGVIYLLYKKTPKIDSWLKSQVSSTALLWCVPSFNEYRISVFSCLLYNSICSVNPRPPTACPRKNNSHNSIMTRHLARKPLCPSGVFFLFNHTCIQPILILVGVVPRKYAAMI